ncbi:MAG: polymer-forming cytoskeletal protein [Bacteroidetes bacterium]|nr:polymer-forming cytoskeletal protein [Bacteroidota bacterium]
MKFNSKEVTRQTFQDTIANRISKGAVIEGDVKSETDIRIDGKIKGLLHCTAKVVIGSTGVFEGDMQCKEASLEGQVTGKIDIRGLLTIKKSARIEGEVYYKRLIVEEGANITGSLTMSGGTTKSIIQEKMDESATPDLVEKENEASQTA